MISKRRKVWIDLGLLVVLLAALPFLWPADEPKYNGRYLSEWLEICKGLYSSDATKPPEHLAAEDAVRRIGTNALPYYLEWIDDETPQWRRRLVRNAGKWIAMSFFDRFIDYSAALRCSSAEAIGRITRKAFVKDGGFGSFERSIRIA